MADIHSFERLVLDERYADTAQACKQLLLFIATARVRRANVLFVTYGTEDETMNEKKKKALRRTLNALKRSEKIAFFIEGTQLFSESTAAKYLLEKCPFLEEEHNTGLHSFYIYIY